MKLHLDATSENPLKLILMRSVVGGIRPKKHGQMQVYWKQAIQAALTYFAHTVHYDLEHIYF